jgi:hypothetical protein
VTALWIILTLVQIGAGLFTYHGIKRAAREGDNWTVSLRFFVILGCLTGVVALVLAFLWDVLELLFGHMKAKW